MPAIIAVGTAVPQYEMEQSEVKEFARKLFSPSFPQIERLLPIFDHTAINKRRFSQPREWFDQKHSWQEKNDAYVETARDIGEEAIRHCLDQVEIRPEEIDHLIFVSTTGMATPSIDAHLINRLQMNTHIKRTPIWGLGCAGGVVGLARAYESAKAFPNSKVLLLAVECCGLTFRCNDMSKSNLVATSLFADGAAAVLVCGDEVVDNSSLTGPHIVNAMSTILPQSLDVMGWNVLDDGLKVVFSRDIPAIVKKEIRPVIEEFVADCGLGINDLAHYITHPGGMKVLQAYEECLDQGPEAFEQSYQVLAEYGNMSSVTVLFVLARELEQFHRHGSYGLLSALGPGFSAELLMLQWREPVREKEKIPVRNLAIEV